jgi:hypothetical protein
MMHMKTLMMMAVFVTAVAANAASETYQVICQKTGFETTYSFSGVGTVTFDKLQDKTEKTGEVNPAKQDNGHVAIGDATADMDFVITTPEGSFRVTDAYVKPSGANNVYTIPESRTNLEEYVVKVQGSSSRGSGELQMLLKGPRSGGTSKITAGGRIYWSNCQIAE